MTHTRDIYSHLDPEQRKSDGMDSFLNLESQLVYRLASLEATVSSHLKRIDEKIETFQNEINKRHLDVSTDLVAVKARQDHFEEKFDERIKKLEFFKTELLAKATAAAFGVGLFWMLLGDSIRHLLGLN